MNIKKILITITQSEKQASQIIRFLISGGLATSTHLICLVTFIEVFQLPEITANIIANCFSAQLSYWCHKKFTFQYKGNKKNRTLFSLFLVTIGLGFLVNQITFAFILMISHYIYAFFVAGITTACTTYITNKYVVFKND